MLISEEPPAWLPAPRAQQCVQGAPVSLPLCQHRPLPVCLMLVSRVCEVCPPMGATSPLRPLPPAVSSASVGAQDFPHTQSAFLVLSALGVIAHSGTCHLTEPRKTHLDSHIFIFNFSLLDTCFYP